MLTSCSHTRCIGASLPQSLALTYMPSGVSSAGDILVRSQGEVSFHMVSEQGWMLGTQYGLVGRHQCMFAAQVAAELEASGRWQRKRQCSCRQALTAECNGPQQLSPPGSCTPGVGCRQQCWCWCSN